MVGPGGEPLFVPGPTEVNVGNSMGVGGYMGNQMIKENAGILGFSGFLPPESPDAVRRTVRAPIANR